MRKEGRIRGFLCFFLAVEDDMKYIDILEFGFFFSLFNYGDNPARWNHLQQCDVDDEFRLKP